MSRKNFKVETAENGQTTIKKIDKTPTGKVKTLKNAEERRKEREEQYRTFRINALKRRAKRMNVPDEEVPKLVEKLIAQLDAPKQYTILTMGNAASINLLKQAIANAELKYLFCGDTFLYIEGDQNVLAKIREIAPPKVTVHPYAKKMEPILKASKAETEKKPTGNTSEVKKRAKKRRKQANLEAVKKHSKRIGKAAAKKAKIEKLNKSKVTKKAA